MNCTSVSGHAVNKMCDELYFTGVLLGAMYSVLDQAATSLPPSLCHMAIFGHITRDEKLTLVNNLPRFLKK
ncbi:hypothetical protein GCM10025857_23600 [Alicyclobacillus contaminans]|nr:hypothetical protein GCM10025857_23600 [Alicyclobacillus contaminans]